MARPQRFETFTNIDFVVRVPITFDPGAPITTLAGATLDVRAKASGGAVIVGEATVDPDNGATIIVVFRRGKLPPGICQCQVWAQVGQQAAMPFVFEAEVKEGLRPVEV